jgi:16S rRNA (cytidine1402-2'-O)-methyltransferase
VVPTPIGDPDDLSVRALRLLRQADRIAAEDTRVTRELLRHHGIDPRALVSCHDHNESDRAEQIVAWVRAGESIALVSDAGTPLVNDPGFRVVRAALAAAVRVEILPGPCAAVTALVGSGLAVDRFCFAGFLPRDAGPRAAELDRLADVPATLVFYESPLRLAETLETLAGRWPTRAVCVARNLTKEHEQWIRGTAAECRAVLGDETRGEVVLLVSRGSGERPRRARCRHRCAARRGPPREGRTGRACRALRPAAPRGVPEGAGAQGVAHGRQRRRGRRPFCETARARPATHQKRVGAARAATPDATPRPPPGQRGKGDADYSTRTTAHARPMRSLAPPAQVL